MHEVQFSFEILEKTKIPKLYLMHTNESNIRNPPSKEKPLPSLDTDQQLLGMNYLSSNHELSGNRFYFNQRLIADKKLTRFFTLTSSIVK